MAARPHSETAAVRALQEPENLTRWLACSLVLSLLAKPWCSHLCPALASAGPGVAGAGAPGAAGAGVLRGEPGTCDRGCCRCRWRRWPDYSLLLFGHSLLLLATGTGVMMTDGHWRWAADAVVMPRPCAGPASTTNSVSREIVSRHGAPGLIHSHRGEFGPR